MAQHFINALKSNIRRFAQEQGQELEAQLQELEDNTDLIRAAALLHDIMHVPYAHTLEDELGILPKGDKGPRIDKMIDRLKKELTSLKSSDEIGVYRIFSFESEEEFEDALNYALQILEEVRRVLWTLAVDDEKLEKMAEPDRKKYVKKLLEPEKFYVADIIGNTICADLLSYILRDVDFTGIEIRPGAWYRLFDCFTLRRDLKGRRRLVIRLTKKGELREDALSAIIGILNVRYALSEYVLYHHAKCAASAMLGKIVTLCSLVECERLYEIGDEGFMGLLSEKIQTMKKSEDSIVLKRAQGAEKLLTNLRARRFYKRFHRVPVYEQKLYGKSDLAAVYSVLQNRAQLEEEIEKELGLEPGSILVFCPSGQVALKEAKALVIYEEVDETGEIKENVHELGSKACLEVLERLHRSLAMKVRNVVEQYEVLWKLYVFVDPGVIPIYGSAIKTRLRNKIGEGDFIFDHAYVESTVSYGASKAISENVDRAAPSPDIPAVYREIRESVESLARKAGTKRTIGWISENASIIVEGAVERCRAREQQKQLPL
jgi:HD superfamily phosphohydrolase